ncbi:cyclase family protein [Nocardiopsis sp. CNT-189]|uniref:cyclase family protein n=1 Tax=Nocardiopsis oceanisediminis TaxID=2816862 RepID=UPI003B2AF2FC
MTRFIDVSHQIVAGMTTYPGLPGPVIDDHVSFEASQRTYAPGTEFNITRISMVANTGTYLDMPAHRYRDGADLSDLELEKVADVPGVVVQAPGREVGPEAFDGVEVAGRAVLVRTGWDRHWRTGAYGAPEHPFLTEAAARLLADSGARLVGIDSVNIDDTSEDAKGARPAHSVLLAAGIPVIEHLCLLELLPAGGFRFFAVPVKVQGMGTFPVRAFAIADE